MSNGSGTNSTWLTNSRRRHEKRTYTPLVLREANGSENSNSGGSDAVGVASAVRSLMMTNAEEVQLRKRLNSQGAVAALDAMSKVSTAASAYGLLAASAELGAVSRDDVREVARGLAVLRSDAAEQLAGELGRLDLAYTKARTEAGVPQYGAAPGPAGSKHAGLPPESAQMLAGTGAFGRAASDAIPRQAQDIRISLPSPAPSGGGAVLPKMASLASMGQTKTAAGPSRLLSELLGISLATRAQKVVKWAATSASAELQPLLTLTQKYAPTSVANTADPVSGVTSALSAVARLKLLAGLFDEWLTQRPLQPLGLLYLERLDMTPGAVERGELSYSLPLAPNEKVTLAHREWSVREEQFSEFIEDYQENFSQQGVAQTDDIALSTTSESSHNSALSMSQPLAAAPGVQVTSAIDNSASGIDDSESKTQSKEQSRTVTSLASTRTMKDHKISFTVTTVAGMEDFTAHLIENKNRDKSMRVDYYKRVRRWQSELYRYGVRLTYDLVLPDPGQRLRQREVELQSIAAQLSTEFSLGLVPTQITVSNWEALADQYGVSLPSPPEQVQHVEVSQTVSFTTPDDVVTGSDGVKYTTHHRVLSLNVGAPANYRLSNLNVYASIQTWTGVPGYGGWLNAYAGQSVSLANADGGGYCNLNWNLDAFHVSGDGQNTVFFRMQVAQSGLVRLTGTYVPTEASMETWRLTCWTIIRDAASARWAQHRTFLRERQGILQKDIAAEDPVRLRRMEREAIMRSVLEWLFPGFEDANSVLASLPSPGSLDPGKWQQVMQYGEYIKFVQSAIDWDNVMVFLYPYFWDTVWNEEQKLFLQHPDAIRREFLRAGAARVILAIQPGYEEDVVKLLDQGQLGQLPQNSRFEEAIQYVASMNAQFNGKDEGGLLIGNWTDYTPSSALDIETTLIPVTLEVGAG